MSAIAPLSSIGAVRDKRYASDVFGLSVEYPFNWFHLLAAERIESFKQVYGKDYETAQVPIFQVTELQEPTNDVNPNFEIWGDLLAFKGTDSDFVRLASEFSTIRSSFSLL